MRQSGSSILNLTALAISENEFLSALKTTLSIMDPFMKPPPGKYRVPKEGMKRLYKQEIISFIESMSFEYIQIPIETTTSTDEDITVAFIQAFCDALADAIVKASPSRSSPRKLVEWIKSPQMDTPTNSYKTRPTGVSQIQDPRGEARARPESLWRQSHGQEN